MVDSAPLAQNVCSSNKFSNLFWHFKCAILQMQTVQRHNLMMLNISHYMKNTRAWCTCCLFLSMHLNIMSLMTYILCWCKSNCGFCHESNGKHNNYFHSYFCTNLIKLVLNFTTKKQRFSTESPWVEHERKVLPGKPCRKISINANTLKQRVPWTVNLMINIILDRVYNVWTVLHLYFFKCGMLIIVCDFY